MHDLSRLYEDLKTGCKGYGSLLHITKVAGGALANDALSCCKSLREALESGSLVEAKLIKPYYLQSTSMLFSNKKIVNGLFPDSTPKTVEALALRLQNTKRETIENFLKSQGE
ncbi:hypothetical protein [Vibrio crassostreae]|uniref:hypothetical protein n=1 Tax=Vibrio crassostreae TaxID=246167 RepID=UPI001B3059B7|nr:hypothetical protein [Vibrio crassostreae]